MNSGGSGGFPSVFDTTEDLGCFRVEAVAVPPPEFDFDPVQCHVDQMETVRFAFESCGTDGRSLGNDDPSFGIRLIGEKADFRLVEMACEKKIDPGCLEKIPRQEHRRNKGAFLHARSHDGMMHSENPQTSFRERIVKCGERMDLKGTEETARPVEVKAERGGGIRGGKRDGVTRV